ncbi:hypothetical protein ACIBFB_20345 [Nocardiopsis sp. NPDC050513]|uniref:hypothetical protein n=1 Tax=Nocardiopsis sp. NPDC050513 TaxID=3364338 RepID=UPI0037926085
MRREPSPEETAAARLLADPGLVRRSLAAEVEAVHALRQGGVSLDPQAAPEALASQIRAVADRIGFESPVEAATLSKRRLVELPLLERGQGTRIEAYHSAASRTLREGALVSDSVGADGTRIVELQRRAPETGLVWITLSARVRLRADGTTWLDDFGWPGEPTRPVHMFTGATEAFLAQAQADLREENTPMDRVLLLLLGATLSEANASDTDTQRLEIAEAIAVRRGELNVYIRQAEDYALASGDRGWYAACLYRSGLENLFEKFLGSAAFSLIDMEEIEDIDDELRERLPGSTGADRAAIPVGTPIQHWWWEASFNG